tara:strand:- start:388 stop:1791 length:1404 start_codon:yes stop_codon:yes gene_type:complete
MTIITTATKLITLIKKLFLVGINKNNSKQDNSKIIISNIVIFAAMAITLPFSMIYPFLGQPFMGIGIVILVSTYSSVFILNNFQKYNLAKFCTISLPIIGIITYFLFMGPSSGVHFILFPSAMLSFILFHPKEKLWILISLLLPITTFIIFELFGENVIITILFNSNILKLQNFVSILISFVFVLLIIKLYISQQLEMFNFELEKQNEIKSELSNAIKELENNNITLEEYSNKEAYIEMTKGIAHEIRSPMTILISGAQLLKDNIHQDQQSALKFADIMIKTMFKLEKLTSIMLKQNRKTTEDSSKFKIKSVLEEIILLAEIQCKKKHISLQTSLQSEKNIYANRAFVSQAILNIIVNAMQHTEKKGVLQIKLHDFSNKQVTIEIEDSGNGIPEKNISSIFDKHKTSSKNSHNSGLGLAFVKRVIDEHNATIKVKSEIGVGTKFSINWPTYQKETKEILKNRIISKF